MDKIEIIQKLEQFIPADCMVSDEKECQAASADRFRRFETIHGVYTQPTPAVIIKAQSTEQVSMVLAFANQNNLNVVPRTGRTATEGGLETRVQNSLVLDGSGHEQGP
jgi:alkyldihydroxyacetonephosphate synthase